MKNQTALIISGGLLFSQLANATTVEFWTAQTQTDRMQTIELLASTFEALNDGVTVNIVPVDENEMATQMAAAVAAGTTPQLVEVNSEIIMALGEEGIVNTKVHDSVVADIGKERFHKGALTTLTSPDDQYYGLPYHGWIQGIWYRKDWFDEKGLAAPNSWENIEAAAKALTDKANNQYGILIGTKQDSYTEQVFTQLALSNNAAEFDEKGSLIFNSPATLETIEFYKTLSQYNPPGPQNWRARDYYLQGKMGMFFYSTYIMDDLALAEVAKGSLTSENFKELSGGTFDPNLVKNTAFAPIISHKSAASYGTLSGLVALKTSDMTQSDATKDFIEFMYDPASYITFLHMAPGGMNPMLKGIAEDPAYLDDPNGVFKLYGADKMKKIVSGFDDIRSFSVVKGKTFPESGEIFAKSVIPRMLYSVAIENEAPQAALDEAEQEMKAIIAK
ncbi:ABC transporter substrate-binding protein [Marinomonas mediterranea]|jgi:ABC-type sugar transport system, periplasmic component|uniref:Extracellular solute-binding protein family 1 n=1 Tax=Marinomonas mediterranea (strain ATCC 700492 / JCM 21426 / NBRC 103028 / MMB-1) TaxID=717774 RepID=F2K0J3_MARM1|nr:extracellular solute-binding protein [Marinomonas mediterranea]ADZ90977.1 extracellular solute-binding protein family 1 [Marinomonas mediterranea MMB-1]WCN09017.1 extracellular solute-binding protein [Marinomonas mediterranea]WCN17120.1 extracellular solute-binding protein [Marinomonas mediterranea MMB-1]